MRSLQRIIKIYLIDFGYMVMNLNRKQLSLLITLFSMAIVILCLYNIQLGKEDKVDEYVVEMLLQDDIEELEKQKEELEEEQKMDPVKSHLAYNEAMKPSQGKPEAFKTLEELMEEREAAADKNEDPTDLSDGEYAERVKELKKKRQEAKQLLGEKEAKKQEFTNNLAKRRTSVSYSLIDRSNYRLPPPIYTCIEGGKVVVNIEVDDTGKVIDADFNSRSSDTSNGCLVENAVAYALKAKFSSHQRSTQRGTITYIFQGKAR
ncbi:energy transducer TonB [Pricia sp.]|uniref:energy transducer TonB family protein n=1 Tax=Pricia sp. TaxID=2268138 RepID=UPI0035930C11